jgi:nicotinate-nucleotide adenylyltransferase
MLNRICLGGSFNPVHLGHLLCARAAAEAVGAAQVVLFPSGLPPHKSPQDIAPANDRVEMCRLAVRSATGYSVDDREIRRPGPSYTIDTVRELKSEGWDQAAWLIGADMLNMLPQWHQADALLAEARFVVMARPGWVFDWASLPASFKALRKSVVEVPQVDISATEIRVRIRAGLPIDFLTPPAVCRYIEERGLYRES